MKLTIGKKIGLGFACVLLILISIGGFSILKMKQAVTGSKHLSEGYVPELDIAGRLQSGMAEVRVNGRSYQFTGEKAYLVKGREALLTVKNAVTDAEALAARTTTLIKLKEQVKTAPALLTSYDQLLAETETASDQLEAGNETATKAATDASVYANDLIVRQFASLEKDIQDKLEAEKLTERQSKIQAFTQARSLLSATRIAYYRSQVMRDPKMLKAALESFKGVHPLLAGIEPLIRTPEDKKELAELRTSLTGYETALDSQTLIIARIEEIGVRRGKAAHDLELFANDLNEAAQNGAMTVAQESTKSLSDGRRDADQTRARHPQNR